MFRVMPCLSGNNISIGFQGLIERFGRRLRGHMLIVPEKTRRSQKHIPLEFSLYTARQTSPSDKKKRGLRLQSDPFYPFFFKGCNALF